LKLSGLPIGSTATRGDAAAPAGWGRDSTRTLAGRGLRSPPLMAGILDLCNCNRHAWAPLAITPAVLPPTDRPRAKTTATGHPAFSATLPQREDGAQEKSLEVRCTSQRQGHRSANDIVAIHQEKLMSDLAARSSKTYPLFPSTSFTVVCCSVYWAWSSPQRSSR
jgi:hypothetical protein